DGLRIVTKSLYTACVITSKLWSNSSSLHIRYRKRTVSSSEHRKATSSIRATSSSTLHLSVNRQISRRWHSSVKKAYYACCRIRRTRQFQTSQSVKNRSARTLKIFSENVQAESSLQHSLRTATVCSRRLELR